MSSKVLYKSRPLIFRVIYIILPLMLPGLLAFVHDYMLFSLIYFIIFYYFSAQILIQVDIYNNYVLIRNPLRFWKKDKKIDYSNVIEFKHYSIPRGQDELKVKYKDINNKIKTTPLECKRPKAKTILREIRKKHTNVNYKVKNSSLHSMKIRVKNITEIEQHIKQVISEKKTPKYMNDFVYIANYDNKILMEISLK